MSVLLLAAVLAQPVSLPAEVKTQPGRLVQLRAETEAKHVGWDTDPGRADLIVCCDDNTAVFCAQKPGSYRVVAFTDAGHKAVCTVVAAAEVSPGPVPPPGPPPPAPAPADPLQASLQAAYDREHVGTRAIDRDTLAGVYETAADKVAGDPRVTTVEQTLAVLRKMTEKAGLVATDFTHVRGVLAAELQTFFGTDPLAPVHETRTRDEFRRIALALRNL